jgi:hypothetical protein
MTISIASTVRKRLFYLVTSTDCGRGEIVGLRFFTGIGLEFILGIEFAHYVLGR